MQLICAKCVHHSQQPCLNRKTAGRTKNDDSLNHDAFFIHRVNSDDEIEDNALRKQTDWQDSKLDFDTSLIYAWYG